MLVLTSYADFPLVWYGTDPVQLHKYGSHMDSVCYEKGVRAYFSDNMAFYLEMGKIYNLKYPNYNLSVVRRDGRAFDPLSYVSGLIDKMFPKGYEIRLMSVEESREHGFPFLYPLWVYEGWIHRQSKRHYDTNAIAYATIQWVNK